MIPKARISGQRPRLAARLRDTANLALEIAHDVAEYVVYAHLRRRMGLADLERRVRALEAVADRMEREDEERERSVARLPRMRRAG